MRHATHVNASCRMFDIMHPIYVYKCIHTQMQTQTHTDTHTHTHTHIHIHIYVYVSLFLCLSLYMYLHVYICIRMHFCVSRYVPPSPRFSTLSMRVFLRFSPSFCVFLRLSLVSVVHCSFVSRATTCSHACWASRWCTHAVSFTKFPISRMMPTRYTI